MLYRTLSAATALVVLAASPAFAQAQNKTPAKPAQAQPKDAPKEPAQKEQPQRLGANQGWSAYSLAEGKGKICYLVGEPAKKEPAALKRERVNALVTHNTADKTSNVVSFVAGTPFADRSDAELDVDGKKFSLFTDKDTAWARDPATDKTIVAALAKGKQAVVKGTPAKGGGAMTDTYNLAGLGQTLALIDKACNVTREAPKTGGAPAAKKEATKR